MNRLQDVSITSAEVVTCHCVASKKAWNIATTSPLTFQVQPSKLVANTCDTLTGYSTAPTYMQQLTPCKTMFTDFRKHMTTSNFSWVQAIHCNCYMPHQFCSCNVFTCCRHERLIIQTIIVKITIARKVPYQESQQQGVGL